MSLSLKLQLITIISLFFTHIYTTQTSNLECLLENQLSLVCLQSLPTHYDQYSTYICPILMKYTENMIIDSNQSDKYQLMFQHTQNACFYNNMIQNGYIIYTLNMLKGMYVQALQLQYRLFFNDPFRHQKLAQIALDRFHKMVGKKGIMGKLDSVNQVLQKYYMNQLPQTLQSIRKLYVQNGLSTNTLIFHYIRTLEKSGLFPQALQQLNKMLKVTNSTTPSHWYLHHLQGNLLMHHLKFKQAIQAFKQSLQSQRVQLKSKQTPQSVSFLFSYYNMGLCYQKLSQFHKSIHYLHIIEKYYETAQIYNAIGFSYSQLGDQMQISEEDSSSIATTGNAKKAAKYYMKAIKSEQSYFMAYYNMGTLKYKQKQYDNSLFYYKQAYKYIKDTSLPLTTKQMIKYGIFKSLYKINMIQAESYLKTQVQTNNNYFDIGVMYNGLGQRSKAMEYLTKAQDRKYNLGEVSQWKALINYSEASYEQAKLYFKMALEYGNNKASIWYNLGHINMLDGKYDESLGLFRKAHQMDSSGPAQQAIIQVQDKIKQLAKQKEKELNRKMKENQQQKEQQKQQQIINEHQTPKSKQDETDTSTNNEEL